MRTKFDYGIYLGLTNAAIARMENGEVVLKKTDTLTDFMPVCISFTKKKSIKVGDSRFNNTKIGSATFKKYFDILFDLGKKTNFTDEDFVLISNLKRELKDLK